MLPVKSLSFALLVSAAAIACGSDPVQPAPPPADDQDSGTPTPPVTVADASAPICPDATGTYPAEKAAGNVLFLMDRSGSMQIKLTSGDTRWKATKTGLFDLLGTLPSTMRAGAMMFPQGDSPISCCDISSATNDVACNCADGQLPDIHPRCDVPTYDVPVAVSALGPLQTSDIEAYVSGSDADFYWGTPLAAALTAAIDAQVASPLDGTKSVVLLTDGYPTSCDSTSDPGANDIQRVIDAAAAGTKQGVRTFVLGVIDGTKGARADYLSPIAESGGTARTANCSATDDCFYALNNQTFAQDIQSAFDQIELQAFDCSFALPKPNGGAPDLSKINVQLETTSGTEVVARDTTHQDGWDFLPNQTHIQLYGGACTTIKADAQNTVDIVVGCTTQGK
ncbi:MAG TPA: hypothetical protein VGH28_26110 [Polyangiaceae bacterium]|jgi:hypothetical protein